MCEQRFHGFLCSAVMESNDAYLKEISMLKLYS